MKKVIFLSCTHHPLDDRIYYKEAIALKNNGFDVTHICFSSRSVKYLTDLGIQISEIKKRKLYSIPAIGSLISNFLFNTYLKEIIEEAIRQRADVYHFCDYQFIFATDIFRERVKGCKIIYEAIDPFPLFIVDYGSQSPFKKIFNIFYSKLIEKAEVIFARKVDHIIVTEETLLQKFKKDCKNVPVSIIHNYSNVIKPNGISSRIHKKYDILYAGLISKNRGIIEALLALNKCKKSGEIFKMLIVGPCYDMTYQRQLNQTIDRLQLIKQVEIKERQDFDEMFYIYNSSRIGLIPFLDCPTHRQIMPIKLFEYLDMEMPVVSCKFGSIGEFVQVNQIGETVNPTNIDQFAESILKLLKDDNYYNQCLLNSKLCNAKFSWKNEEKVFEELYKII